MASFGARLQTAREQRGISLRQIAAATRISMTALEALERDDFSRLPGGIFSRAFIRSYAREVGLDPEVTVNEFLVEMGRYEREAATVASTPQVTDADREFLERQRVANRMLRIAIGVVVIALVALAIWLGPRLVREVAPPSKSSGTDDLRIPEPPPSPRAASADTAPAAETGALSIDFTVTSDCSVQVSADGVSVYFHVMRAGERKQLFAQREFEIQVDNAGAFVWYINGRPAKALGVAGQRQKVHLTAATLADFLQ